MERAWSGISVLFAMLRDGTFYEPRVPEDVELAA